MTTTRTTAAVPTYLPTYPQYYRGCTRTYSNNSVHEYFSGGNSHEEVASVTVVQQLAQEVKVGHERRLEDDGHVGRVEQLDGVRPLLSPVLLVLHLR